MITSREQVTQRIVAEKVRCGLKWKEVAETLGQSKEWATAACLGQMQLTKGDAEKVAELFGLDNEGQRYSFAPIKAVVWLQTVPHKSSSTIPADPLLYRFYEVLGVYGTALKELIHEEFGDGIMSAVDFSIAVERQPNALGDRVNIVWSGKFLPYKSF